PSYSDLETLHASPGCATCQAIEVDGPGRLDPPAPSLGDDRPGERVLGVSFDCGGQAQDFEFVDFRAGHGRDGRLALCERAGLVEDHDLYIASALQREAILDKEAVPGTDR